MTDQPTNETTTQPLPTQLMDNIIEAALFAPAHAEPLTIDKLTQLFNEFERPSKQAIREALERISQHYQRRGIELVEVKSGFRFQTRVDYAQWLQRLWEKKPARLSRALLETLALIIYRQPITRGEIEQIRGVAVSTQVIKTLMDQAWIKIVGYKSVPGKPAMFGSTKTLLDYFGLKKLSDLPPLPELVDVDELAEQMDKQLALPVEPQQQPELVE